MKIIDTHVYCIPERLRNPKIELPSSEHAIQTAIHRHIDGHWVLPLSSETEILNSMEKSKIEKSILIAFPWASEHLCEENSSHILDLQKANPKKFASVCSVQIKDPRSLEHAKAYLDGGAVGIKINGDWQGFDLKNPQLDALAKIVQEKNAYILVHVDQSFKTSKVTPGYFLEFAKRNPETNFVAAHMGGLLGLYQHLDFFKPNLKNVWFDTAVSETLEFISYYIAAGLEDKIIFGSDFPFNFCHSQKDLIERIENLNIEHSILEKIFFKNYLQLIGNK